MKKILMALLILASTAGFSLAREDGVNIYDTPREPPSRPIYTETGRKVNLADFKGDFLIAVFWSRYCAPCLRELDNLNRYQKIVRNDGIRVILISPDTEWNTVDEMKKMLKNTVPAIWKPIPTSTASWPPISAFLLRRIRC